MNLRDKTIISGVTLFSSLTMYWYAKHTQKDTGPYVMIGAFVGSIIGELIAQTGKSSNQ